MKVYVLSRTLLILAIGFCCLISSETLKSAEGQKREDESVNLEQKPLHEQKLQSEQKEGFSDYGIKKISGDLYVGKVADGFYLAIERVDSKNIDGWVKFSINQLKLSKWITRNDKWKKYLPDVTGSKCFNDVMQGYKQEKINNNRNELWVTYASSNPVTGKVNLDMDTGHIEMFVAVLTSPEALITTHMGITRSGEVALGLFVLDQPESQREKLAARIAERAEIKIPIMNRKISDQSIHVHSFAAKVMKMRNPKRVYMLTVPTPIMRTILVNKMPRNTIFVGTVKNKEYFEAAEKDPLKLLNQSEIDTIKQKSATPEQQEKTLRETAEYWYKEWHVGDIVTLLRTNPARIIESNDTITIQTPDGGAVLVSFNSETEKYQWIFSKSICFDEEVSHSGPNDNFYMLVDLAKLAEVGSLIPFEN